MNTKLTFIEIKNILENLDFISIHNHSHRSNIRLLDCIIKEKDLVDYAIRLGHRGICLTDHECVSGHVSILKYVLQLRNDKEKVKLLRKQGKKEEAIKKEFSNLDLLDKMKDDFKIGLGNEIYLVDSLEEVRDNYKSGETKFYHFLLVAKDKDGHKLIRNLSSKAWMNSFKSGKMDRVPSIKKEVEEIIGENKGHLIASTACLGGELANNILRLNQAQIDGNEVLISEYKKKIHTFIKWCIKVFGKEDFYIELQPSHMEEQIIFNRIAINIAKAYDLKCIITTDTHYLKKEHKGVHSAYLNSKEGDRETADFYSSTYLMTTMEIYEYLKDYLTLDEITGLINNTYDVYKKIETYDLKQDVVVPEIEPPKFQLNHIFEDWYDKYEYIKNYSRSPYIQDLYLLYLIEKGFIDKNEQFNEENINRINTELMELWNISETINMRISAYYVLTQKIVDLIWDDKMGNSLVGVARGSVTGYYTAYLINITQLNPIKWNLPHWRHLSATRPELPDIDLDSEASKRQGIFNALMQFFGFENVLNICTFKTEGSRSTVLTACRGLNIDNDTSQYIADMIPFERGSNWTLSECLFGDEEKERKPVKEFINEIEQYKDLKETMLAIEGIINGRSIHASGVYVFKNGFLEQNSLMKAPNGKYITAWNMEDSDYNGGLKVDLLTIEALDKLRVEMDLLLEYEKIQWQGTLRKTYNKYLHPDTLDYKSKEMWNMKNEVEDLFQFNTKIGIEASKKINYDNLIDMATANSVMRLVADGDESPIDTYAKYKEDISLWYKEMREYGLNEDEIKTLEKYLLINYGVATTQEDVMEMVMDKNITDFSLKEANKIRKAIAKKKQKLIDECKKMFYEKGKKIGTRPELLNYVWDIQIKRQLGYSFSRNHTTPYSVIGLQEMNMAYHYNILFWNCAVLTINSGANEDVEDEYEINSDEEIEEIEEDSNGDSIVIKKKQKNTNYGKIATAISQMQNRGVNIALPHINKAKFGFIPDEVNDEIIFGLKGVNGIGDDVAHSIIKNRPYSSFKDFLNRMTKVKLLNISSKKEKDGLILNYKAMEDKGHIFVGNTQVIKLIKAGCFDRIEDRTREDLMLEFIKIITPTKDNLLNLQNMPSLLNYNCIPDIYNIYVRYYKFRKYIFGKQFFYRQDSKAKTKGHYVLDDKISAPFFLEHFSKYLTENKDWYYNENGHIVVIDKNFTDKAYNKAMESFKDILNKDTTIKELLNKSLIQENIDKYAKGNISQWEMDAISFYYSEHELTNLNNSLYSIDNYFELDEEPVLIRQETRGNRTWKIYQLNRIAGTVLDKDKNKHIITLLTTNGVVTVKFYAGAFNHYNSQISKPSTQKGKNKEVVEKSWFTKGEKLLITGIRTGDVFRPKVYTSSVYKHSVSKILSIREDGTLEIQQERKNIEDYI